MASNKELEAMVEKLQAQNAELALQNSELSQKFSAIESGVVTTPREAYLEQQLGELQAKLIRTDYAQGLSPIQADPELINLKNELINLKGELQVTLDAAKVAAGLNVPKTQPINPSHVIPVPQPLGPDGKTELPPPPGAVRKKFRVTLQDCATRFVELWEIPGQGFASHGMAIAAFNKYMGIMRSDYAHEVTEVTGPTVMVAPPRTISQTDMGINSGYPANIQSMLNTGEIVDPALSRQRELVGV